jgi:hypothetical protein
VIARSGPVSILTVNLTVNVIGNSLYNSSLLMGSRIPKIGPKNNEDRDLIVWMLFGRSLQQIHSVLSDTWTLA